MNAEKKPIGWTDVDALPELHQRLDAAIEMLNAEHEELRERRGELDGKMRALAERIMTLQRLKAPLQAAGEALP